MRLNYINPQQGVTPRRYIDMSSSAETKRPARPSAVATTRTLNEQQFQPPAALFVYGTLMPGQSRSSALEEYTIGTPRRGTTTGSLHDAGRGFPAYWPHGTHVVPGYLVQINPTLLDQALERIDEIEGVDTGLFTRTPTSVHVQGEPDPVTAYVYASPHQPSGRRITSWPANPGREVKDPAASEPATENTRSDVYADTARQRLQELLRFVQAGAVGKAAPWEGARVIISDHQPPKSPAESLHPTPTFVVTPHRGELSWLYTELWAVLSPVIGTCKLDFFHELANTADQHHDLHPLLVATIEAAEHYLRPRPAEPRDT